MTRQSLARVYVPIMVIFTIVFGGIYGGLVHTHGRRWRRGRLHLRRRI
jgi:hypothetical protein